MRAKTPTGVQVRWWEPFLDHRWYVAYCNTCPWESGIHRRSIKEASRDGHRHHATMHQVVLP